MQSVDVKDRIESAERMLRQARSDLNREDVEETIEFLRSAERHTERAIKLLESSADVVDLHPTAATKASARQARNGAAT